MEAKHLFQRATSNIEDGVFECPWNAYRRNALLKAISAHDVDEVREIVERFPSSIHQPFYNEGEDTPLRHALKNGPIEIVRLLIQSGAEVNIPSVGDTEFSSVEAAIRRKDPAFLQALIDGGVNPFLRGGGGNTPLNYCREEGDRQAGRMLLKAIRDRIGELAPGTVGDPMIDFTDVINYGTLKSLRAWVNANPELVHMRWGHCDSSLYVAALTGNRKKIECLIDKGADINDRGLAGYRPYLILGTIARGERNTDFLEYLIAKGADPHLCTNENETVFFGMATNPCRPVWEFLHRRGCNLHAVNKDGETVLHQAAGWNKKPEVLDFLISLGMNINAQNHLGDTPLHYAAKSQSKRILKFLVSHGADIHIRNDMGNTPLQEAMETRSVRPGLREILSEERYS